MGDTAAARPASLPGPNPLAVKAARAAPASVATSPNTPLYSSRRPLTSMRESFCSSRRSRGASGPPRSAASSTRGRGSRLSCTSSVARSRETRPGAFQRNGGMQTTLCRRQGRMMACHAGAALAPDVTELAAASPAQLCRRRDSCMSSPAAASSSCCCRRAASSRCRWALPWPPPRPPICHMPAK